MADNGLCRTGLKHYCPNCDNSFVAAHAGQDAAIVDALDAKLLARLTLACAQRDELLKALKHALHVLVEYPTPGIDPDSCLERCAIAERMGREAIAKAEAP